MNAKKSRRQAAGEFAATGRLRQVLEMDTSLSHDAINLIVDIVLRYCEPRRKRVRP